MDPDLEHETVPADAEAEVEDDSNEAISERGGRDLESFFRSDRDGERRLLEVIEKHTRDGVTPTTWKTVWAALTTLVGLDATTLINWVAASEEDRYPEVERHVPADILRFLRKVGALYSPDLVKAYELANQLPNNWRVIYRDVFHDLINNRPYLRLRIEKFNGEEVVLEGSGDAILGLARQFLIALQWVGSGDWFSESVTTEFRAEVERFVALLEPEAQAPSGSAPAALPAAADDPLDTASSGQTR